jgi:ribonucleotide monophosphatase NagD (HAD superfamily)
LVGEALLPAAGAIAALYEEMGGVVTHIGKPYVDIYRHAHALCGFPDKARIVSIGDSLEHDIRGAVTFGIDGVLAMTGVQAHVSEAALPVHMREAQVAPRYLLGSFVWSETAP